MNRIFKFFIGGAALAASLLSCKPEASNTLEVAPSGVIEFAASGNDDVVLNVTTDATDWNFTAPEWVVAEKGGNTLTVNAQENDGEERIGRIEFTAGNAEAVKVTVMQSAQEGGNEGGGDKVKASLKDASGQQIVNLLASKELNLTSSLILEIEKAVGEDVTAEVFIDEAYLNEFNFSNKMECTLFPVDKVTFANDGNLTVTAGETLSDGTEISFDCSTIAQDMKPWLVPVCIREISDNASVGNKVKRVNYVIKRQMPKEVKQFLFFEVNDTNPLNALEYVLEDGTYFFDAVVLFAANIRYTPERGCYLHNNPNVQTLLDESDVYIQPLREKGIKVYLGLLGDHTPGRLVGMSAWGCEQFAQEIADACLEYGLDGVNLDDEYSKGSASDKWFTPAAETTRLALELKIAMKHTCPWPTEVTNFEWGLLYQSSYSTIDRKHVDNYPEDDKLWTPGEYLDVTVANYGSASTPQAEGLTLKNCSCMSVECAQGRGEVDEAFAARAKEQGYGWCMWFALAPNREPWNKLDGAARGFYGQSLKTRTGYYKKLGEGVYDPQRYER